VTDRGAYGCSVLWYTPTVIRPVVDGERKGVRGINAEAYVKQSVILNYPLSSDATKHPVDVTSPTHCLWLPATQTPSTAHSLLPLQCHYV